MDEATADRLAGLLEAVLVSAGRPLPEDRLLEILAPEGVTAQTLPLVLERLSAHYAERMIELAHTASGWQVRTRPAAAPVLARIEPTRVQKYSRAVLETLALIAWRQPVTRGDIEAVRGVSVNPQIVRTLVERGWVEVVGRRERPGRPELLGTTRQFLDDFGLKSLSELPDFETFSGQGSSLDV
ncbi:MAG: SMC-Scp complex subunit ScpB [Halothiobacillaceae bacterium]